MQKHSTRVAVGLLAWSGLAEVRSKLIPGPRVTLWGSHLIRCVFVIVDINAKYLVRLRLGLLVSVAE